MSESHKLRHNYFYFLFFLCTNYDKYFPYVSQGVRFTMYTCKRIYYNYYNQDLHSKQKYLCKSLIFYIFLYIILIVMLCNVTTVIYVALLITLQLIVDKLEFYLERKNNLVVIKLSAKKKKF